MVEDEGPGVGRREFLSRIGAGCVAVAGGTTLLPDPPASAAVDPVHGSVSPGNGAVDETATPFAVWQYRRESDGFEPTSPINVVFPLDAATFGDVTDVFRRAGWYLYPEEYARYAWDRDAGEFRLQSWSAAETYFGQVGRYHVRCWHIAGTASIQVHADTPAVPEHGIASYSRGRSYVESLFADDGWHVDDERLAFGNDKEPDHDGHVSVIHEEPTGG